MTTKYSNISDVPLALAVFLATDSYDSNEDPNTISATALMKPIRQIVLPPRLPPGEGLVNLEDMLSSRLGTAVHDAIERSWLNNHKTAMQSLGIPQKIIDKFRINPGPAELLNGEIPVYLEQRLSKKLGKWVVTGKFDFISEGMLQDFKNTSTWVYLKQVNTYKYQLQGSIYRWLDNEIITSDSMQIHFIFTDWKSNTYSSDPNYPKKKILTQNIPLLPYNQTEKIIKDKLKQIEQYWDADEELIPECTDEDLWRSEPVYKYYKNPSKTSRSTKNFSTMQDAYIRVAEDNNVGIVIVSPGEVKACKYCPAFSACSQKDRLIASGDLIMK